MARSQPTFRSRAQASLLAAYRKVRTPALVVGLCASVTALAILTRLIHDVRRDNATIAALRTGEDIPVDLRKAAGEVLFARSEFLLRHDRREEAQALLDSSAAIADPKLRARLLANHANARIRLAIAFVERGNQDNAVPLTRLAKDEYRLALRLDPDAWDVKYNYDVAMRIVRDFPGYDQESEDIPPDAPKRLWTDLPGVPKGLP
jgi:mxaK protein